MRDPIIIFLVDGIGAMVSSIFLLGILVYFQSHIGMPLNILLILGSIALCFMIYSLSAYFFLRKLKAGYLLPIILPNASYVLLTSSLTFIHYGNLSLLGRIYFIGEILILIVLISVELAIYKSVKT